MVKHKDSLTFYLNWFNVIPTSTMLEQNFIIYEESLKT